MNSEQYHALTSLSASTIKTLLQKSAMHARLQQTTPIEPSAAMQRGTIIHSLALENVDIMHLIDAPDYRTKAAQEQRDNCPPGTIPMLTCKVDEIYKIATIARTAIQDVLKIDLEADGQAEATVEWREGTTPCKARLDWLKNDATLILDLKITELSSPQAFARSIASSGYDIQAAWYKRAVRMALENEADFVFCVVEAIPPYPVYFLELDAAFLAIGSAKAQRGIQLWTACLESNTWPGYPSAIQRVEPPSWELAAAEELDAETHGFDKEAFLFGRVK